jgi:hypothetical protein
MHKQLQHYAAAKAARGLPRLGALLASSGLAALAALGAMGWGP